MTLVLLVSCSNLLFLLLLFLMLIFFLYDTHARTHKCIITGDRAVTLTITQSDQSPKAQNQPEQIRLHSFKDPDTVMNI